MFHDSVILYGGSYNFNSNTKVRCLSLKTLVWKEINVQRGSDVPEGLDDHTAVVHENEMIVFGGFDGGYRNNQVYSLNLKTFKWKHMKAHGAEPSPRTGHTAVIYGNNMAVFGGKNDENEKLNDTWIFNIFDQTWKMVQPETDAFMPVARSGHSASVYKGEMIVFGGIEEITRELNDTLAFNLTTQTWKTV